MRKWARAEAAQVCQPTELQHNQTEAKQSEKFIIHTVKLYSLVLSGEMCLSSIDFSVPYNNVLYDKDDDDIQPEGIRRTNETNYWN